MKSRCFDIGVIQTFVDGELGPGKVEELVKHLSHCEACTLLATELETENEAAFAALDCELDVLVPTERLRSKVFASIQEIESKASTGFWSKLSAAIGLTGLAARPGVAAFASILFLVAFAAVGMRYMSRSSPADGGNVATVLPQQTQSVADSGNELPVDSLPGDDDSVPVNEMRGDVVAEIPLENPVDYAPVQAIQAAHRVRAGRERVRPEVRTSNIDSEENPDLSMPSAELDAEDGYLRTIATLNRTVDENKDYVLRPSERVVFERDLAVVNDAIKKMKGEVRQNPRNNAAREVLRSSYKNKIDLLNSVAERSETVASLD